MERKLRFTQNLRLDLADAERIHDEADAGLREHGRLLVDTAEPGLTLSAANSAPDALVVSGWTVRVNPASDQQLLITPGVAVCAQVVDGVESFGQVTVAGAERVLAMSGGLETKGVWARFVYLAGTAKNRARWRPDLTPSREQVFVHDTAQLADCELALSHGGASTPPAANAGWFKIAEVNYGDGAVVAADIVDRRTLLFEGEASGSANPATTWNVPDFDRGASRGTVGARSVWGWLTRVNKRLEELSGRAWYAAAAAPGEESVRSAAAATTVGSPASLAPTVPLSATPTAAEVLDAWTGNDGEDRRAAREFLPAFTGARQAYSVDCSAGSVSLSTVQGTRISGAATFSRTGGTNALFRTETGGAGFRGTITGIDFAEASDGAPVWYLEDDADNVIFEDCAFSAFSAGLAYLIRISGAGRYVFKNCRFVGADKTTTVLALVEGGSAAQVSFVGCYFGTALTGVRVTSASANVFVVGCTFNDLDKGVVSTADGVAVAGCRFTNIVTYDTDLQSEANYAPGGLDGGAQFAGEVSARTVRVSGNTIKAGVGDATLTVGATVSGDDGTGTSTKPIAAFHLYTFAGANSGGKRVAYVAAGGGAVARFAFLDAGDAAPTIPLHARRLMLGGDATDARAVLSAHTTPRAWGLGRYDNTTPAAATQEGGGRRYDEALVSVVYTPVAAEHAWVVSGLGMENDKYAVVANISLKLDDSNHVFEAGDGYSYGVAVVGKTDDGFTLVPWCRDKNGVRVAMDDDLLTTDVGSYEVDFNVFGHGAPL